MNLNTPPRLNQLLSTLRQPQWIAAILSLGFHGVLFAAGPSFSSLNTTALNNPDLAERRVPLIELSPEEQGRLPDFSDPAYSLLPESNDDLFSLFPPSGSSLPLNPESGSGSSFSVPTPRLPSSAFPGSISPYRFPRSSIVLPSRRPSLPSIPRDSAVAQRPTPSSESAGSSAASTPTAESPDSAAQPETVNPNPSPEDGSQAGAAGMPAETTPLDPGEATPESQQASDLLARVEYSDTLTSESEVEFAKAAWLQTVKDKLGDGVVEAPEPITLQVPYSGRLCLSPEPTEGLLGLVAVPAETADETADETNPGSTLWTSVLKSTGYPFLNQAAEQVIQGMNQQADADGNTLEPNTLYQVIVKVEYDSETCVSREALLQSRTAASEEANPQPE